MDQAKKTGSIEFTVDEAADVLLAHEHSLMIDLAAMKHGDIPGTPNAEMNARSFVITDNATIGIQSGNIAKHSHPKTDEIQYIVEGSGAMWLGGERKEFKAGTLIIIPKGRRMAARWCRAGR